MEEQRLQLGSRNREHVLGARQQCSRSPSLLCCAYCNRSRRAVHVCGSRLRCCSAC